MYNNKYGSTFRNYGGKYTWSYRSNRSFKRQYARRCKNVVLELGAYILKLDGKGDNIQENKEKIEQVISNGEAYRKFLQLVENQGGDIGYIENTEKFTKAKYKMPVEAVKTGYVQKLNAEEVGKIAMHLGAGRMKKKIT